MSFTNAVPEVMPRRGLIPTVIQKDSEMIEEAERDTASQGTTNALTSLPHSIPDHDFEDDSMSIGLLSVYDVTVTQGVCLMIVNKKFEGNQLSERKADHAYIDTFRDILESVNIQVIIKENRTGVEILQDLQSLNTKELSRENSILFVVVVSHGQFGQIYGVDGQPVTISEITKSFSHINRPKLRGIPKIFIIQCCQTFNKDGTLKLDSVIPVVEQDVHVEYSALPGQYDFDVGMTGSVYFRQLNKVLKKHMHDMKLMDIFQHTRRKLEESPGIPYKGTVYKPCSLSSTSLSAFIKLVDSKTNIRQARPAVPPRESGSVMQEAVSYNSLRQSSIEEHDISVDSEGYTMSVPPEVTRLPFFYLQLHDKEMAKQKLAPYRTRPGYFLLRRSREAGLFTFAITHNEGQLLYMRMNMRQGSTTRYSLVSADREFSSVEKLVNYYKDHPIPNQEKLKDVYLKTPISD